MKIKTIIFIGVLLLCFNLKAQDQFFISNNAKKYVLPFKIVNNLIVIPVKVNGKSLSFLLDTGVSNTVILNIKLTDSLQLRNTQKIKIQGLGDGEVVDAVKSTGNLVQIGKSITNRNHKIYLIIDGGFNLTNRLGEDIHGIIGGDLFKDFVVKINYSSKKIVFYKPEKYVYRHCSKCETLPLTFFYGKPYLEALTQISDGVKLKTNLLIDSGNSDALWLKRDRDSIIKVPEKYFDDYLGQGLNGNVFGKRSRIKGLEIGKFALKDITVSFPNPNKEDSLIRYQNRQGSIGAETLKRFNLIFDYGNKKLTLQKNSRYYSDPFNYNMSGIEVAYNGKVLVSEKKLRNLKVDSGNKLSTYDTGVTINYQYRYVVSLKNMVQVTNIRAGSPADLAGVKVGDYILKINNRPSYDMNLQQITTLFYQEEGKRIKLIIQRNDVVQSVEFNLKKIL